MQNGRNTWFKLLGWHISYYVLISPIMEFMWMSWCWFRGNLWASVVSSVCMFALRTSLPLSVSAPTHQGGDSHHVPPGKWQSAEASPKKGSIASANLLVVHYLLLFILHSYDTCHPRLIFKKWQVEGFQTGSWRMIICVLEYIFRVTEWSPRDSFDQNSFHVGQQVFSRICHQLCAMDMQRIMLRRIIREKLFSHP